MVRIAQRFHLVSLLKLLGFSVLFLLYFTTYANAQDYVPGEVIVKLRSQSNTTSTYAFLGKSTTDKQMTLQKSWGKMNMYHFTLSKGQSVEQTVQELRQDPDVEYAEPNYILRKADGDVGMHQKFAVNDSEVSAQTAINYSQGIQPFWSSSAATSGTVVATATSRPIIAVIDTGLDPNHSVFIGTDSVWVNTGEIPNNGIDDDGNGYVDDLHGWNFVANSNNPYDDDGHGTHVAGIILSVDQDIYNPPFEQSKVQIMPLKFLDGNGQGTTSSAIAAIYYAVNNGAVVLNNSWGGYSYSAALHEAVTFSYNRGVAFVAAAGNSSSNNDSIPLYPASLDVPNVISVAATTSTNTLAYFSNYGVNTVHIGSPGVYIMSTIPGNYYGTSSGTSMAAPYVAGAAIQMKVVQPNMLGYQIKSVVMSSSQAYSQLIPKVYTGSRVDSTSAITKASIETLSTSQPAYSPVFLADRKVASSSGGGCGMVSYVSKQGGSGGAGGGASGVGSLGFSVAIMIAFFGLVFYLLRTDFKNQRQHERFKIDSEVRVTVGDKIMVGNISTISVGGVCLNTSELLQDGGLLKMQIVAPDGNGVVEVEGRVVWSEERKAYGVAFQNASMDVADRIGRWTQWLAKAN